MAALPYMRFYPADYLADTAHLSPMQHGIYLLLLMNYWQRGGPLPDDDKRLASIARVSMRDWKRNRDEIIQFFTVVESHWRHGRVDGELAHVEAKSLKSKGAAQASVQRRFGERSADVEPTDTDKNREGSEAKASAPVDPEKRFWADARAYLGAKNSSLIGKWIKDHGREATAAAIAAAQVERAVEPVEFIQGRFRKMAKGQNYDRDRITV
jgi:uncharacterized protein YdaU (DUF1376 family)